MVYSSTKRYKKLTLIERLRIFGARFFIKKELQIRNRNTNIPAFRQGRIFVTFTCDH